MPANKDLNVCATRLQVVGLDFPEELKVNGEEHFEATVLNVVVPHLLLLLLLLSMLLLLSLTQIREL